MAGQASNIRNISGTSFTHSGDPDDDLRLPFVNIGGTTADTSITPRISLQDRISKPILNNAVLSSTILPSSPTPNAPPGITGRDLLRRLSTVKDSTLVHPTTHSEGNHLLDRVSGASTTPSLTGRLSEPHQSSLLGRIHLEESPASQANSDFQLAEQSGSYSHQQGGQSHVTGGSVQNPPAFLARVGSRASQTSPGNRGDRERDDGSPRALQGGSLVDRLD